MRTNVSEVKEILPTSMDDSRIEAFIKGASAFLDATLADKGLSDTLMKEIERWMSAHMITTTSERQLEKASAGPTSTTFAGQFGKGLYSSTYGQTVVNLDSTGTLKSIADDKGEQFFIGAL